jgi:hypothetical protein
VSGRFGDGGDIDPMGFDALDGRLGDQLRAAAPRAPEPGGALAGLRPRMTRARRRHRAVVGGVSALGVVAAITLGVVLVPGGGGPDVQTPPATRPDATSTTQLPTTTPTTLPSTAPTVGGGSPDPTTPTSAPDDHGGDSGNQGPGGGSDDDSGGDSDGSDSSGSGSDSSGSDSGSGSGSDSSGSGSGSDD